MSHLRDCRLTVADTARTLLSGRRINPRHYDQPPQSSRPAIQMTCNPVNSDPEPPDSAPSMVWVPCPIHAWVVGSKVVNTRFLCFPGLRFYRTCHPYGMRWRDAQGLLSAAGKPGRTASGTSKSLGTGPQTFLTQLLRSTRRRCNAVSTRREDLTFVTSGFSSSPNR